MKNLYTLSIQLILFAAFCETFSAQNTTSGNITVIFTSDRSTMCSNEAIQFTDQSTGTPTPSAWLWTFSGGSPATSTLQNPMVTYNSPGQHNVILQVSNGTNTLTTGKLNFVTVSECTGISNYNNISVNVFPNPSKDFLYVTGLSNAEYKIYNLIGSELKKGLLKEREITKIDLEGLPASIYLLCISKNGQTRNIKVIKE